MGFKWSLNALPFHVYHKLEKQLSSLTVYNIYIPSRKNINLGVGSSAPLLCMKNHITGKVINKSNICIYSSWFVEKKNHHENGFKNKNPSFKDHKSIFVMLYIILNCAAL